MIHNVMLLVVSTAPPPLVQLAVVDDKIPLPATYAEFEGLNPPRTSFWLFDEKLYYTFSAIQIFDFDYALLSGELDVDKFVSLSSDIMLVEMVHRVFVSSYEVC